MLAQNYTSPIEDAEAKVQQYVGEFLQNKLVLTKLLRSPDVEVQRRAVALMTKQKELEPRLEAALKVIEGAKKGVWTIGSIAQTLLFANEMVAHNRQVRALSAGKQLPADGGLLMNPMAWFVGLSAVGLIWSQWRR